MNAVANHPAPDKLSRFAAGLLDEADSLAIESHLADCGFCAALLEAEAGNDTFVSLVRSTQTLIDAPSAESVAGAGSLPDWRRWTLPPVLTKPAAPAGVPVALASHERYRVLELIGSGGMGAVYKAEHRKMQRLVALKTIRADLLANESAVERFHREIRAAAQLHHPNIVTAHDADQAGDVHFLAMEYVEGITLAQEVERHGPLPVARACDLIRQIALGLQHAHERGLCHRDIKPANVLLAGPQAATPKITDFGLARFVRESAPASSQTELGAVMGTPDYMAPEQGLDSHTADIRADIYSLGCTLYFLLTGKPPFHGPTPLQTLLQHQQKEPTPLSQVRPDVPAGLQSVLARMMHKRPDQRYQTPGEVAAALAPFADAGHDSATTIIPAAPTPRKRSRRLIVVLGLAAVLVVLILGVKRIAEGLVVPDPGEQNLPVAIKQPDPKDKTPPGEKPGEKPADKPAQPEPATLEPMMVRVTRNHANRENPLPAELRINGQLVANFLVDGERSIDKFLQKGWNTITIKTTAQEPAQGENGLFFKFAAARKHPKTGKNTMGPVLWKFGNDLDWTFKDGKCFHALGPEVKEVTLTAKVYFTGTVPTAAPRTGDYIVTATPQERRGGLLPSDSGVSVTVFVNETPVGTFLGEKQKIVVTPLLKKGENKVRVVSCPLKNSLQDFDIHVTVAGPAEWNVGDRHFDFKTLVDAWGMTGWKRDGRTGQMVNTVKAGEETIERVFTITLEEAPKVK